MERDLPRARRDVIAERLIGGQPVVATSLATEFDVSEDAIRRDLRALAAEGRCRRVYGGALPVSPATASVAARAGENEEAKRRLAREGAGTIRPGELVFVDSGSTHLLLSEFLPEDAELTVATNAVDVAAAVLRRGDVRLVVVGGLADPLVGGCVDAEAVQAVGRMRIDRAFIGACSVSAAHGVGAFHFADATFKRALFAASSCTIVLATADKLAVRTPHIVAGLEAVDLLLLERSADPDIVAACARRGRDVRVA